LYQLEGAAIRSGDHVLVQPSGGHGCPFVGQLIDVNDGASIPKGEIDRRRWRKLPKRMTLVRWLPWADEIGKDDGSSSLLFWLPKA
jgi:hypothetical protein